MELLREKAGQDLQIHSQNLEILAENVPGGVHQRRNDPYLTITSVSKGFLDLFGYTQCEISNLFEGRFLNMIHPADRAAVMREIKEQLSKGKTVEVEYRVTCKNGIGLWLLDRGNLVTMKDGTQTFVCILLDITQRRKSQEVLRLSLERHKVIMDQATDIIFEWDIRKDTLEYSSNWQKKFGYPPIESQISTEIPRSRLIHPDDMPCFLKIMVETAAGVPYSETEFRIKNESTDYTWCRVRATTQFDEDGKPIKAVGVIIDIDEEKKQKERLLELAQKDALTGLYNKATVNEKTENCLQNSKKGVANALMIIDVDNFKSVNDSYGHLCGDAVLSDVAKTLRSLFRATDLVGRIGGDEFLAFMSDVDKRESVEKKARDTLEAIQKIVPMAGEDPISCSIGIMYSPRGGGDYYGLCRCADRALYYVKNSGRGSYAFYAPAICDDSMPSGHAHSAINSKIDSEEVSAVDEKLVEYAFSLLYASLDVKKAFHLILETVGQAYDVSRAYIFESSEDGLFCNNTFEWCKAGVKSEINSLQNISYEKDLGGYLKNFDENGVFYCQNIKTLHPDLYNILEPQGIVALLQCAIRDDGTFKGYVGFDECRTNRYWTREQINSLTLIANVLSTFLLKLRLKEQVARLTGD